MHLTTRQQTHEVALVPCAIGLWIMSRDFILDPAFYVLQTIKLVAGAINLTMLLLNAQDGLRISQARRNNKHLL